MLMLFTWVVTSADNILFGIVQSTLTDELAQLVDTPAAFNRAPVLHCVSISFMVHAPRASVCGYCHWWM